MKARGTHKKQKFIAPILGFLLALVIVYSGFWYTLMAFLLVGAIPGTTLSVSPTIMLVFFIGASWYVIFRVLPPTFMQKYRLNPDHLHRLVQYFRAKVEVLAK